VASTLIEIISTEFEQADATQRDENLDYADTKYGPDISAYPDSSNFENNEQELGVNQISCDAPIDAVNNLKIINQTRLIPSAIDNQYCLDPYITGHCTNNPQCANPTAKCDLPCQYISCMPGNENYNCAGDEKISKESLECKYGTWSGSTATRTANVDLCTCYCRPSVDLIQDINQNLEEIYTYVKKTYDALNRNYIDKEGLMRSREETNKLADAVQNLRANQLGYDVTSRITPKYVKYDTGDSPLCYINPTYEDREKGVCGNSKESFTVYAIQISAASLASILFPVAAPEIMRYATNFFPLIYETSVRYEITETLIDDGNRVALTNLATNGTELYTYAPLEFEIYKNQPIKLDSEIFGRIIVYIYLPKTGLNKAVDGLISDDCVGDACP
jgi:hypothetical protein